MSPAVLLAVPGWEGGMDERDPLPQACALPSFCGAGIHEPWGGDERR